MREILNEIAANRKRRFKPHSMTRKFRFRCPIEFRRDPEQGEVSGRPRCIPARRAVGGSGAIVRIARETKLRARAGRGKRSRRISLRWKGIREPLLNADKELEKSESIASELAACMAASIPVRFPDRVAILDSIVRVFELLGEEMDDDEVWGVYETAVSQIGLFADVDDDGFCDRLRPVLDVVDASLRAVCGGEKC